MTGRKKITLRPRHTSQKQYICSVKTNKVKRFRGRHASELRVDKMSYELHPVLNKIINEVNKKDSWGNKITVVTRETIGNHRSCEVEIKPLDFPISFFIKKKNDGGDNFYISVEVRVKDYPKESLEYFKQNDEPFYGCPHHYELSEDKTAILYVRHGTTEFGETEDRYVEKEYETARIESLQEEETLLKLFRFNGKHGESTSKGIKIAIDICKAVAY